MVSVPIGTGTIEPLSKDTTGQVVGDYILELSEDERESDSAVR